MIDINNLKSAQQYCYPLENTSCLRETRTKEMYVMLYVCSAASVILTILGNVLVVISVSHFRQLHTPSNLIVLSLAAADFLVGILLMPLKTIQIIEGCWYFGDNFCYFHALFGFLLTSVSVSNMVFIAIDRYVAVCDPLLYGTKITIPLVQLSITTSWISSILYAWAILFFKGHYLSRDDGSACLGECVGLYTDAWGIVDLIVSFILPCTVIVCLYSKVFMVARRHSKVMNLANQQIFVKEADQNKIPKKSERKAAKTLGIVISVFLLFWVPFYLCAIINAYTDVVVSDAVINSFIWLAYLNSGMNPIIYALFYPWFQKSAKLIVSLKICSPESSIMNLFSVNH